MEIKNIEMRTERGILYALDNYFHNYFGLMDAIEDAENNEQLLKNIKSLSKSTFVQSLVIDRERENYIRLKGIDFFGNIAYLILQR